MRSFVAKREPEAHTLPITSASTVSCASTASSFSVIPAKAYPRVTMGALPWTVRT